MKKNEKKSNLTKEEWETVKKYVMEFALPWALGKSLMKAMEAVNKEDEQAGSK